MVGPTGTKLVVGKRYINAKNRQPLTLLYIGPLPPQNQAETSGPSSSSIWLGVEYDDATYGKGHSGSYENIQIFQTKQEGAGAFIRSRTGDEIQEGKTFMEAINERYTLENGMKSVILGSSNSVIVEAPGMEGVNQRLRTLERLRQIGLEDELICGVGGSEMERAHLRERLRGVKMLNISRNLLKTWEDVEGILQVVGGLNTLIMNDSRLYEANAEMTTNPYIKDLHLARSLIVWPEIHNIIKRFEKLEELHLSGNMALAEVPKNRGIRSDTLKILSLDGCGIKRWELVEDALKYCPRLETLNLSSNPLESIAEPGSRTALRGLKSLILLETTLDPLASLVHLSARIPHLENLRFTLACRGTFFLHPKTAAPRLSGNDEEDRVVLLALFPNLVMLNGNDIKPKEREEAERRFCSRHTSFDESILQSLLERLTTKHGLQLVKEIIEKTSLRSKMITLHIYPTLSEGFTLSVLPSSPVSTMKRKISKKLGLASEEISLWTVKRTQRGIVAENEEVWVREKVMEVQEGEVGYWFDDGDGVIVDGR